MQLAICKQCWLKNIFDMAGLSELFMYNGCNRDITNFIMLRYRDQFIQVWNQDLSRENSRRGCRVMNKFEQEPDLAVVKVVTSSGINQTQSSLPSSCN